MQNESTQNQNNIIAQPIPYVKPIGRLLMEDAFIIPDYQRSYAWEVRQRTDSKDHQINDFWDDIKIAFNNSKQSISEGTVPYYWGTITVKKENNQRLRGYQRLDEYSIVDGQQRITTMILLLLAFYRALSDESIYELIVFNGKLRLTAGSLNRETLEDLVLRNQSSQGLDMQTNQRINRAFKYFQDCIKPLSQDEQKDLIAFVLHSTIGLKFDTGNERLATQAFLSLNDRGKSLTIIEKLKGVLAGLDCNYINSLSARINEVFGTVYRTIDKVNSIGERNELPYFKDLTDEIFMVLCYHYFAPNAIRNHVLGAAHDSYASASNALEFIRSSAMSIVSKQKSPKDFLSDFLDDIESVSNAIDSLAQSCDQNKNPDLYRIFGFLKISKEIVPIIVAAQIHNYMTSLLINELENVDLRVFKIMELNRITPFYTATLQHIRNSDDTAICEALRGYRRRWAPDEIFSANVATLLGREGSKYLLWEYQYEIDKNFNRMDMTLLGKVTIEHIFAQTPRITFPGNGFENTDEYSANIHFAGNLSLLEQHGHPNLQRQADNLPPLDKARVVYFRSAIPDIVALSRSITSLGGFSKKDVDERTHNLQQFAKKRWA